MTPERWEQIKDMLFRAMQVAPEQRSAFLDSPCPDTVVRHEVEVLLAADDIYLEYGKENAAMLASVHAHVIDKVRTGGKDGRVWVDFPQPWSFLFHSTDSPAARERKNLPPSI